MLPACSNNVTWQEEVKLSDGRVIVVTQKRLCEGTYNGSSYSSCIPRDAWLTLNLPELGKDDVTWNARLDPMVLNVHQGQLYIVGTPPTKREFDFYGRPQPHYLAYKFQNGQWQRTDFNEIPEVIYDTNLLLDLPPKKMKLVTLSAKASQEMNGDGGYTRDQRRVDPNYKRD